MHVNDTETLHNNDPFRRKLLAGYLHMKPGAPFTIVVNPNMDM